MTRLHAVLAGLAAVAGSVLAAVGYLATNRWFGAGDLSCMILWSLPLGVLVFGAVLILRPRLTRLGYAWHYSILLPLGAALGIAWGVAAALILGGWIFAFSFPVFICWLVGGLSGGVAAAWTHVPRTWPLALALLALVALGDMRLNAYAQAPPPRLRVFVKANATPDEVRRVWEEVLGRPHPSGRGHDLRDGITGVGVTGYEDGSPILTVSLQKRIGSAYKESLLSSIRSSPLVARVEILPDEEPATMRRSVEY